MTEATQVRERSSIARWLIAAFLTLRGRLILLVCFATVPALLFIFFAASREREAAVERLIAEARHLGSLASREHAHQLAGGKNLLRRLAGALECDATAACPEHLPSLLAGLPQLANIGVAEPDGDVSCSAAPLRRPVNLGSTAAFRRALDSLEVEAGTYVIAPIVGRPVLHLAYAVRGPGRSPCAVLFVALELGWLGQLARQANLPRDYSLLIADSAGNVLARSGPTMAGRGEEPGRPVPGLARVLPRPRGAVLRLGEPAVSRYFVATPMQGMRGVFVVAGLPYDRVQGKANWAFYRTLAGLVLVTIFAIASAILAAELSVLRLLRALTRAVRKFGAGDLTARAPLPQAHGELRELAASFGAMADTLAARQREAEEAQVRLRALSQRVQAARDEEAERIARELHDELGQVLTGLKLELARLRRVCSRSPLLSLEGDQAIAEMTEHVDRAIDSVRRISSELRSPVLDRLGLAAAIDWLVRECEVKAGITGIVNIEDLEGPVDGVVSTTVFRVVQEALTNVVRHAGASEVRVDLACRPPTLSLTIRDDGKGMEPGAATGSGALGILGMRERVHLLGGVWRLHSAPSKGTTIEVVVPREGSRAAEPRGERGS
ncbi:MAG: HAMP domain-containing protein [Deltaproteobacteria bacterium]|nr:HAMP domain-containing protein [Deltaproteobacteria bacterium]